MRRGEQWVRPGERCWEDVVSMGNSQVKSIMGIFLLLAHLGNYAPEPVTFGLLPPIISSKKPPLEAEKWAPDFSDGSDTALCPLSSLKSNLVAVSV